VRGRRPVRPLAEIADAAVAVFTAKGFRPAGISDVAAALGLSHGALYTYVDSKQALLYLALLRAMEPATVAGLAVPLVAPPAAEIVAVVEKWAANQALVTLATPADGELTRPIEDEFGEIVDLIYGFIERNRHILKLVAGCAADLPELARWYFVERRRAMFAGIADYLARRIGSGHLRPVPDLPSAARFVVETCAWFAMHRHGDPDSRMLNDDDCRRTVRHLLLAAFLSPPAQGADNGRDE
jgi:AcrR family transcriptional regulator